MIRVSAKDLFGRHFTQPQAHKLSDPPLGEFLAPSRNKWRRHLPTGILPVLLPWMRWCLTDLALAPENKLSINLGCRGGTARPPKCTCLSSCRQHVWKTRV